MAPLNRLIFDAGVAWRNPRITRNLAFLLESESWSRERLHAHQDGLLSTLVARAARESSFYRRKFTAAGIDPSTIRDQSSLSRIPPLEKKELLENAADIQSPSQEEPLFYSETSGSTGQPLVFYRNADWDAWHNASVMRGFSWHGVHAWERNGYLWGFNLSPVARTKTRLLDTLQNRFRMFSYDDEDIRQFVNKLRKAVYLGGYSSMIYEVAKAVNRNPNIEPLTNLRLIRGTSEKIFERYQAEAVSAFGRRIISEYGAAEAGIIAFECAAGSMHINAETCIVEVEDGQILVTNLVSKSFPIIRYRLGDEIVCDPAAQCSCGRAHPIIREVTGRIGKSIHGQRQRYPSLTLYYVFKNLAVSQGLVLNYQAVQTTPGQIVLRIEQQLEDPARVSLRLELEKYFGSDLLVDVVDGVDLRSTQRKKHDFVSSLE